MTLEILISCEARADIAEALAGFREISPPLAARFGVELERVYSSIVDYSEMYPIV